MAQKRHSASFACRPGPAFLMMTMSLLLLCQARPALAARRLFSPFTAAADPQISGCGGVHGIGMAGCGSDGPLAVHRPRASWLPLANGRGPGSAADAALPPALGAAAGAAARQLLQGTNPGLPLDERAMRFQDDLVPNFYGGRARDPNRFRPASFEQEGRPCVDCRTCRRYDANCRAVCSVWCPQAQAPAQPQAG